MSSFFVPPFLFPSLLLFLFPPPTHIPQPPSALLPSASPSSSPFGIALGHKFAVSGPASPSRGPRGLNFGVFNPICPSSTPSQATFGLKIAVFDPLRPFRGPPGLNFGVFNPICLSATPSQGPPGLKTRIPEPADPFRCRLLGLQVRSRRGIYRGSAPNPGAPQALSDFAAQSHGPGRSASPDLLNYLQLVSYVETVVYVQEEVVVGVVS